MAAELTGSRLFYSTISVSSDRSSPLAATLWIPPLQQQRNYDMHAVLNRSTLLRDTLVLDVVKERLDLYLG
jgi:hypothetical protein